MLVSGALLLSITGSFLMLITNTWQLQMLQVWIPIKHQQLLVFTRDHMIEVLAVTQRSNLLTWLVMLVKQLHLLLGQLELPAKLQNLLTMLVLKMLHLHALQVKLLVVKIQVDLLTHSV